ncbi:MAG: AAA family ATPase [Crocinitomix sp.]|nr:AAA family ATPase [Crocinitomix sp.]
MSVAIEKMKKIIDLNVKEDGDFKNFVLQGGAGSGKTESLKEIISYVSNKYPSKKIACITLTNAASDEIKSRIGHNDNFTFSTIHSFLDSLVKDYKKNIKEVIHHVFCLKKIETQIHKDYKSIHEKFSKKLFSIEEINTEKVIGKRDYDKSPSVYNTEINDKIDTLNEKIIQLIDSKPYKDIEYNLTRFDSFKNLGFSHKSLITVSHELCLKFDLLPKIISDKYDYIFIDEYQDTSEFVINIFLNLLPKNNKTTLGLFGDSMQGIYDDGIGDIKKHIEIGSVVKINKEDNYRCSKEVIDFINVIRTDEIEQKLALKREETKNHRAGSVSLHYSICGKKPNAFSKREVKKEYLSKLNNLITLTKKEFNQPNTKILMLTNKSISLEMGFVNLYNIFSARFTEVKDDIEKEFSKIQISDIINLCKLYSSKKYNPLIVYLKKNGFIIKSFEDKKKISQHFEYLLNTKLNLQQVLDYCFKNKLIKKSEGFKYYFNRKIGFLKEYDSNSNYQKLEKLFISGSNTPKRLMENHDIEISVEKFDEFYKALKKKTFYIDLFSDKLDFQEVVNYYSYLNEEEETEYITMHKTKGSGIENVMVVLDEYFWNKYNFKSIYDTSIENEKRHKNQKLFYVASSRTIKNLAIVRMIEDEKEEVIMKDYFKYCKINKV